MDDQVKFQFKGLIALCDQAIAPLRQLDSALLTILKNEQAEVQGRGDDASLDKVLELQHTSRFDETLETLDRLKRLIEKYPPSQNAQQH